jgi:site-specific DNA-cytosine methylase
VCETAKRSRAFLDTEFRHRVTHCVSDAMDLLDRGATKCVWHGNSCSGVSPQCGRLDLMTFGPPCQPFTRKRVKSGKGKQGGAEEHPDFHLATDSLLQIVDTWRPRGLTIEQVPEFDLECGIPDGSWCKYVQKHLAALGYASSICA